MQRIRNSQRVKNNLQTVVQVVVLSMIWFLADFLVSTFHIPLPANLTGMLLLLTLVIMRVIKVDWLRKGATWLLAEMLLFFVPAVIAVVNYQELMQQQGLRIMAVLVISTIMVIAITAWIVDKMYRLELILARRKSNRAIRLTKVERSS
ncbi:MULTISPECIES: CidA/LrgA family protein [unclassified Vibrio]|uniref:CidA/LrgA family protein n=1 Tax=unclassified Vibrio TaxID=2614977 RepID=UPI001482E1EA|nr:MULTISPECIES: CidA/LrgA family protein [unclassified Vibrio]MDQ2191671.1 CidA/LrgA family protein [Vibrio sp. A14(2019)]MDQ2197375.1 CidA/LrgA family protein [Vibrio sp. 2017_1457_11]NNN76600.1 CidA/LrgA family protein [Vibrio sp. B7]NNN93139.1 CidA/LrgA family protein [Vibrio sp. B8-1]NNO08690.1 CidA/LrgA family protein [Vibrio sp. B4-12]